MTAKEHNRLIGIFLMAHGSLQGLIIILMCIFYAVIGSAIFASARHQDQFVGLVFIGMVAFILVFSMIFIVPQILGGWKLYKERPNARTWGIIGSIFACMSFPLGTAAGVYGLWFLFGDQGRLFYLNGQNQMLFQGPPEPPPPNSWQ